MLECGVTHVDALRVRQPHWQDILNSVCRLLYIPSDRIGVSRSSISNNSVQATAFKAIAAPRRDGEREEHETARGLRVADKGFMNTAVIQREITYIDGDAGGARSRTSYALAAWKQCR